MFIHQYKENIQKSKINLRDKNIKFDKNKFIWQKNIYITKK